MILEASAPTTVWTTPSSAITSTPRRASAAPAEEDEIIISRSIHDRFKENKKVFTKLPSVTVKGKTQPIDVYRVEY